MNRSGREKWLAGGNLGHQGLQFDALEVGEAVVRLTQLVGLEFDLINDGNNGFRVRRLVNRNGTAIINELQVY